MSNPFAVEAQAFDLTGVSVMLGICVNRDFPWQTTMSLLKTQTMLHEKHVPYEIEFVTGGSIIDKSRSELASLFLRSPQTHLFMLDSDQQWTPKDFIRILALATKMECVCASYTAKVDPPTFFIRFADSDSVVLNKYGCMEILGTGLGFTCVQRKVLEEMAAKAPKYYDEQAKLEKTQIFRSGIENGQFMGEDMRFFKEVVEMGYKVNLDPTLEIGHVGAKVYKGKIPYDAK